MKESIDCFLLPGSTPSPLSPPVEADMPPGMLCPPPPAPQLEGSYPPLTHGGGSKLQPIIV